LSTGGVSLARGVKVVVSGIAAYLATAPAPARAAPPDEDLNNRGVELRAAAHDKEAREVFQQAYDMTHSPRAAAQLGLAYQALGRWEAAEPLVKEGLAAAQDPWIKKYRTTLENDLVVVEEHIAHIELTGHPSNADVYINGRPAGRLPIHAPIAVSIGEVDIELRAPGYRNSVRRVTLTPHQYQPVFIRLDNERPAAGQDSSPASAWNAGSDKAPQPTAMSGATPAAPSPLSATVAPTPIDPPAVSVNRRVIKWTSLGLAVVGLGTAVTASILYDRKVSEFGSAEQGSCAESGDLAVDRKTGLPAPACQSLLNSYRSARALQVVGFAVAGAFAAAWIALQLTEPSVGSDHTATAWSCAPGASPAGQLHASCMTTF